MSSGRDEAQLRQLRMEMLRMRAGVERAELVAALRDLRGGADRLRNLSNLAGGVGAAVTGRSGWLGLFAALVRKPWAAAFALGALRALKRRPLLAVAAVAAAAATGLGVSRTRRAPAPAPQGQAPQGHARRGHASRRDHGAG